MKNRLEAFKGEIKFYSDALAISRYLCLTGINEIGCRSLVKLLSEEIKDNFALHIFDDNFIEFNEILSSINKTKEKILICIPDYSKKNLEFHNNFQKLLQGSRKDIYTIININAETYLNLNSTFPISIKPITRLEIIKPRSNLQLKNLIGEYATKEQTEKYSDLIYNLSGGIPGLMQKVLQIFLTKGIISEEILLEDAALKISLDKLRLEYNNFNPKQRKDFGLIDNKGIVISKLLKLVLQANQEESITLAHKLLKVFQDSKGSLITNDIIDEFLSENGEFSLWNRYKLIERVRKLINKNSKLLTIRNKGYKLISV